MWKVGCLSESSTFTFVYETYEPSAKKESYIIQFEVRYRHRNQMIHRVTTVKRDWTENIRLLAVNFDQEAAVVLLQKLSVFKFFSEVDSRDRLRQWLDHSLIKWA